MFCAAAEHFIQVAVTVRRGSSHADRSAACVHEVLVCTQCQTAAVIDSETLCRNGKLCRFHYSMIDDSTMNRKSLKRLLTITPTNLNRHPYLKSYRVGCN